MHLFLRWRHLVLSLFVAASSCAPLSFAAETTPSPRPASLTDRVNRCPNDLCRFRTLQDALQNDARDTVALRTLGDYYLTREQYSAAREEFRAALAIDAADWRSRERIAELDLRSGKPETALAEFRKLEQEKIGDPEVALSLATAYERMGYVAEAHRLVMAALQVKPSDENTQTLAQRIARRERDTATMVRIYQLIAAANPENTDAIVREAALLRDQGNLQAASAVIARGLNAHPNDAALLAAVKNAEGGTEAERSELHKQWAAGTLKAADQDAPFLVNVAATIENGTRQARWDSDATYLADVRIDRVGNTGLATTHVQQLIRLNNDAGAQRYSSRSIQYAPSSETLTVVRARLHKQDGRVLEGDDEGDERVADRATAMFYDVRSRTLHFATAEPGDLVELEYKIAPATPVNPYGDYFASMQTFRGNLPAVLKRYVVVASSRRKLYISGQSMPQLATSENGDERTYRWDASELAATTSEPLGPPSIESTPYVHVSTLRDFEELGHWYSAMLAPQLALSPELKAKAASIMASSQDPMERVREVYRFVLTSTHYVALEFGIYSYKPYPVADVYARRFGDCKDKASLMVAMLRAVGVPADFVLVRTRPLGATDPHAASIALFNHAIAYVPQFDLWLDGTADFYALHELPLDDQGAMALTVDVNGNAQLRTIPVTRPADNLTSRVVQARIQPNGTIDFTGVSTTKGEDAPALRRDYEVAERQRESMRRGLAELFPTIKLDAVDVENTDSDQAVEVKFAGTLDVFRGQRILDLRTTWLQRDYLQRLALLATRTQDVQLGAPWTTREEFHFHLPAGATIANLPQDSEVRNAFGTAHIHYAMAGHELMIRSEVEINRTRIETGEYAQFRDFCATLERSFRREIKVVLP